MSKQSAAQGLDCDLETFRNDLQKASEIVVRLYGGIDRARIRPARNRVDLASLFDEPLPEAPQPMQAILQQVENNIFANSTLYLSPRFFGYINSGGNQASIVGELLASAVNQICALWHFSPAASEVERRVIRWIAEFIGYTPAAGGCLLSGGSAGNLVGLAVARRHKAQFGCGFARNARRTSANDVRFAGGACIPGKSRGAPGHGTQSPRIHGELLKLGFDLSERSVSRWIRRAPRDPDPVKGWLTFLRNHREAIAAMDFFTVPTLRFGVLYWHAALPIMPTPYESQRLVGARVVFRVGIIRGFRGRPTVCHAGGIAHASV